MIVLCFLELALACSNPLILWLRIKFKYEGVPTLAVMFREIFGFSPLTLSRVIIIWILTLIFGNF